MAGNFGKRERTEFGVDADEGQAEERRIGQRENEDVERKAFLTDDVRRVQTVLPQYYYSKLN